MLMGTALAAGLGFFSNVILGRVLPIEIFGEVAFFYTCITLIFTVAEMGFGTQYVVKTNNCKSENFNTIAYQMNSHFSNRRPLVLLVVCAFTIPASLVYGLTLTSVIGIVIGSYFLVVHKYLMSVCQSRADWKNFNLVQMSPQLLRIVGYLLVGLFVFSNPNNKYLLEISEFALIASIVLAVSLSQAWMSKEYLKQGDFKATTDTNLMSGIRTQASINCVIILLTKVDIFLVMYFFDSSAVGLYFAANSVAMIFPLITRSLTSVYLQRLSSLTKADSLNLLREQWRLLPAVLFFVLLLWIFSEPIMLFTYGSEFSEAGALLLILSLGYLGGIIFVPFESYFYGRFPKNVLISKVLSLITMLALVSFLIKEYGLLGIAISLLLSKFLGWVVITYFYKKASNVNEVFEIN